LVGSFCPRPELTPSGFFGLEGPVPGITGGGKKLESLARDFGRGKRNSLPRPRFPCPGRRDVLLPRPSARLRTTKTQPGCGRLRDTTAKRFRGQRPSPDGKTTNCRYNPPKSRCPANSWETEYDPPAPTQEEPRTRFFASGARTQGWRPSPIGPPFILWPCF